MTKPDWVLSEAARILKSLGHEKLAKKLREIEVPPRDGPHFSTFIQTDDNIIQGRDYLTLNGAQTQICKQSKPGRAWVCIPVLQFTVPDRRVCERRNA